MPYSPCGNHSGYVLINGEADSEHDLEYSRSRAQKNYDQSDSSYTFTLASAVREMNSKRQCDMACYFPTN
jgi:hypothetical protein